MKKKCTESKHKWESMGGPWSSGATIVVGSYRCKYCGMTHEILSQRVNGVPRRQHVYRTAEGDQ